MLLVHIEAIPVCTYNICPFNKLVFYTSQGHNLHKLQYISLEEVKIVSFQQ